MAVSLPDDTLLEIFVRVNDAATLFRCAAACWHWRHLIVDPSFLRCMWPDQSGAASFAAFFNMQRHRDQGAKVLVPTPWSPLGRGRRAISSFVHNVPSSLLYRAAPLVCRRGLLLVHLLPPRGANHSWVDRLAVCNLLVGRCDLLPPLMDELMGLCPYDHHGCAVLSGDDCRSGDGEQSPGSTSFYKVIIITTGRDPLHGFKFDVHTFSCGDESWSMHTKCFGDTIDSNTIGSLCQTDAIVHQGAAHWLFRSWNAQCFCLVKLEDARSGDISFTRLPIPVMHAEDRPCLGLTTTQGALSVLRMQEAASSKLEIWRQQEEHDGTSQWLCTDTVELIQPWRKVTEERDMLYILGEKYGKLLVSDRRRRVYLADLETGTVEAVADWHSLHPNIPLDVVPLEMDWAAFFLSRLGSARYMLYFV
ncbi:hypothetical protein ZWY2020_026144 [Hordeum vulgare]|nr:hypothetical protein ZWY2020_026144 [Hordeum vulgare]